MANLILVTVNSGNKYRTDDYRRGARYITNVSGDVLEHRKAAIAQF